MRSAMGLSKKKSVINKNTCYEQRETERSYPDIDNQYPVCRQHADIQISAADARSPRRSYDHAHGFRLRDVLDRVSFHGKRESAVERLRDAFCLCSLRSRDQPRVIYRRAKPLFSCRRLHHRHPVPIFVLLLAAVILKEPITRKKSFGVFMGVSGGLLLVFSSTHTADSISSLDGDVMMIVSGLMYAIYLVLSKPLSLRYSSVTMMKWMFLFTTLTLVPFTFRHVLDAPAFHREVWDFKELSAIFYVLFGATFLPYLLIPMSLKRIRPTTVSMYNYVQPIVASFIAVMIGQDTFSWQKFLSAILVFIGVYLVTQSKSREDIDREQKSGALNQ